MLPPFYIKKPEHEKIRQWLEPILKRYPGIVWAACKPWHWVACIDKTHINLYTTTGKIQLKGGRVFHGPAAIENTLQHTEDKITFVEPDNGPADRILAGAKTDPFILIKPDEA